MSLGSKYDCQNPIYLKPLSSKFAHLFGVKSNPNEYLRVSCGHCLPCRIKKSKEWQTRMMMELHCWNHASFITLTYSDENLPWLGISDSPCGLPSVYSNDLKNYGIDMDSGKVYSQVICRGSDLDRYSDVDFLHPSLYYKDFQDFMKRLRKHYGLPVKMYVCGEYGSLHERPHWHAVIYGPSRDWMSSNLPSIWKNGFTYTEDVNVNSIAYVAGYVQKKMYVPVCDRDFGDQVQEFHRCSQGVGLRYFEMICGSISEDDPFIMFGREKRPVPRTFRRKMYDDDFCASLGVGCWRKLTVAEVIEQQLFDYKEFMHYCSINGIEPRDIFRSNYLALNARVSRWQRHNNIL